MGTIKIILNQDVSNLGEEGDIKVVKKGYARNFLFPKKFALNYSKEHIKTLESKKDYYEKRKLDKRDDALKLKEKLENEKLSIEILAGDKGRLYGTVTTSNIFDELIKLNYSIDKKKIELKEHIKFAGTYKFRIHLYQDIYAVVELKVIAKQEKKEERPQKGRRYNRRDTTNNTKKVTKEKSEDGNEESIIEEKETEKLEKIEIKEDI